MSLSKHHHADWPAWQRGLTLSARHLYGLEDYLLARSNLIDPVHGLVAFDSSRSLVRVSDVGRSRLELRALRGVTRRGQAVVVDEEHPLHCAAPSGSFDVSIRVRDERHSEAQVAPVDRSVGSPASGSRLSAEAVGVASPNAPIEACDSSLYLGRFEDREGTLVPVNVPWVRCFAALAPPTRYAWAFQPLVDALQRVLDTVPRSSTSAWHGAQLSLLLPLALTWRDLPLPDLALRCWTLNQCLRLTNGSVTLGALGTFEVQQYLDEFAQRPPTPEDFAALVHAGWQPPEPGFRPLGAGEYRASYDGSRRTLTIEVTTFVAGEISMHWPAWSGTAGGVRCRVKWSQGFELREVDGKSPALKLPLGPRSKPETIELTELPPGLDGRRLAEELSLSVSLGE